MSETTKPTIAIYDMATDKTVTREMNESELAQHEADKIEWAKLKAQTQAKATARAAILDRLGLTAEEAALLLS